MCHKMQHSVNLTLDPSISPCPVVDVIPRIWSTRFKRINGSKKPAENILKGVPLLEGQRLRGLLRKFGLVGLWGSGCHTNLPLSRHYECVSHRVLDDLLIV